MAKRIKLINVETLPNGYSLKFDGMSQNGGYLYFTPEKLLEGFMLHIGLEITDQLNTETMQDFIVTAMNWRDNKKCVKEIGRLTLDLQKMTGRRASLARQLILERNRYIAIIEDVSSAIVELKDHPDKNIKKRLEKILSGKKKPMPLTLRGLGVKDEDFIEEETDEDDEP